VAAETHTTAESMTTDEAPRTTPVTGDKAPSIIARPDPVRATIGRNCAVSVDAVITVDPHGAGTTRRRRRVRIGRPRRIVATTVALGIVIIWSAVITRSAIVGWSAITWASLLAIIWATLLAVAWATLLTVTGTFLSAITGTLLRATVTRRTTVHISPELTLRKSRRASDQH
jgi:hypothetical protein